LLEEQFVVLEAILKLHRIKEEYKTSQNFFIILLSAWKRSFQLEQ